MVRINRTNDSVRAFRDNRELAIAVGAVLLRRTVIIKGDGLAVQHFVKLANYRNKTRAVLKFTGGSK